MDESLGEGVFHMCKGPSKYAALCVVREVVGGKVRGEGDIIIFRGQADFRVG